MKADDPEGLVEPQTVIRQTKKIVLKNGGTIDKS